MSDKDPNIKAVDYFGFNAAEAVRLANTLINSFSHTNYPVDTVVAGLLLASILGYSTTDKSNTEIKYYFRRVKSFIDVLEEITDEGVIDIGENKDCDCADCVAKRKSDPNPNLH